MIINHTAWLEGMLVRPQHFQHQEAFLTFVNSNKFNMLQPHFWGIYKLDIDQSALTYNKFLIKSCRGIFSDATWFHYQQAQNNQLSINVSNENQGGIIYLVVTDHDYSQYSEMKPANMTPRYLIKDFSVRDKLSNDNESHDIQVAELNLRLCTDADNTSHCIKLPLAKIHQADEKNGIILDEEFLPPTMNVFATTNFVHLFNAIADLTERKRRELLTTLNNPDEQQRMQMSTTDGLLLLQIINRYAAVLSHQQNERQLHPHDFYQLLLGYVAELATYATTERSINEWVKYKHEDLTNTFTHLHKQVQFMLQARINQQAIQIPLSQHPNGISKGLLSNNQLIKNARFILTVKTDSHPQHLVGELIHQIKIAASSQIDSIIKLQLRGLKLNPLNIAPAVIPYDQHACYFEFNTQDENWEKIVSEQELCLYITKDYKNINLHLWLLPSWKKLEK